MASFQPTILKGLTTPKSYNITPSKEITRRQRQTRQIAQQEKNEFDVFKMLWTPLELVFDVLQRPVYATANIGEDLARIAQGENVNLLEGLLAGITGKRKGSWKTTLFGGQDVGEKTEFRGMFPESDDPIRKFLGEESQGLSVAGGAALGGLLGTAVPIPVVGTAVGAGLGALAGGALKLFGLDVGVGPSSLEDVIGFVADIVFDPTTYLSFGTTAAGKATAKNLAQDEVLNVAKKLGNLDELRKIAKHGFDEKHYLRLGAKEAKKYLAKHADKKDLARFFNKLIGDVKREVIGMTAEEVQGKWLKNITADLARYYDEASELLAKKGKDPALAALSKGVDLKATPEIQSTYMDLLTKLEAPDLPKKELKNIYANILAFGSKGQLRPIKGGDKALNSAVYTVNSMANRQAFVASQGFLDKYAKLGERAWQPFGLEIGKKVKTQPQIAKSYRRFVGKLRNSKAGQKVSDILYSAGNLGPVRMIKQTLGIRNAYEEWLNAMKVNTRHVFTFELDDLTRRYKHTMGGFSDEEKGKIFDIFARAQLDNPADIQKFISNKNNLTMLGVADNEADKIISGVNKINDFNDYLYNIEEEWVKKGLLPEFERMSVYLPNARQINRTGGKASKATQYGAPFTQHADLLAKEKVDQEIAFFQYFLGINYDTAADLVKNKNWSSWNFNLDEMYTHRIFAHAKAKAHVDMAEKFQVFGIKPGKLGEGGTITGVEFPDTDKSEITQQLVSRIKQDAAEIPPLGIRKLGNTNIPVLKDMYFDNKVAGILEKVESTFGTDEGFNTLMKVASGLSSHWKAMATLSPGFHIRNAMSNSYMAFLKDGFKAFDPDTHMKAFIGTLYGLAGDEGAIKILKKMGISEGYYRKVLSQNVNGVLVKDLADEAKKRGIISTLTQGYDKEAIVKELTSEKSILTKINPFSIDNIVFEKSQQLGSVLESTPKFQSFLTSLKGYSDGAFSPWMYDEASYEVKKWFFDYSDLTDTERKVLQPLIPFYTFVRKNVAAQYSAITSTWSKYALAPKLAKTVTDEGISREDLPDWMREEGYIPTGTTETGEVRAYNPSLPYQDLNTLPLRFRINDMGIPIPEFHPSVLRDTIMSAASPLIKTFLTLGTEKGYDPFKKKDLDSTAIAPRALRFVASSPHVLQFIDGFLKTVGFEDGLEVEKDKNGKLRINGKIQKLLEDNFILLRRIDQVGEAITNFIPGIEQSIESLTGYKEKYEGIEKVMQTMSFALGIKFKDYEQAERDFWDYINILKEAEKKAASDRRKVPGEEQRSLKWRKRMTNKFRRYGWQ